jgi:hypothetical protein
LGKQNKSRLVVSFCNMSSSLMSPVSTDISCKACDLLSKNVLYLLFISLSHCRSSSPSSAGFPSGVLPLHRTDYLTVSRGSITHFTVVLLVTFYITSFGKSIYVEPTKRITDDTIWQLTPMGQRNPCKELGLLGDVRMR